MLTLPDEQLRAALAQAFPAADIDLLPPLKGSANRHAQVTASGGQGLFVKIYDNPECFQTEQEVLRLLGSDPTLSIRSEQADITAGVAWVAFPWVELEPVQFTLASADSFGRLMGRLHKTPTSQALEHPAPAIERVEQRLDKLAPFPDLAERAARLWELAAPQIARATSDYAAAPVLLQNDFGDRNIFRRRDTGELVLIDFERAGVGDAHWELGKLWDRELYPDSPVRERFLGGYRAERGLAPGAWPHLPMLWLIRFVATLAIFPYATRVGDHEFFDHGVFKLELLEAEAAAWR